MTSPKKNEKGEDKERKTKIKRVETEPKVKKTRSKEIPNAFLVSQYYGFNAIDLPEIIKEDKEHADKIRKKQIYEGDDLPETEETTALLRSYKNKHFGDEITNEGYDPVLLYCEGFAKGAKRKLKRGEKILNLHIIGTPKSIAEAILIKTALCILEEEGFKDISVEINNLGGKDALANFMRELTAYYRKHINDMDSECRQLFKDGTHALVSCGKSLKEETKSHAPSPFNFLSDSNKTHLKEVIEFLDVENIPYAINKDILGNPHYSSDTVFTILDKTSGKILATGSRYTNLAKKTGHKDDIHGIGVTIKLNNPKKASASQLPKHENIKFFFIQLGFEAKLKSLQILEDLRKAKIPVHQLLSRDKLGTQLAKARKYKVPYILIIGQKEAHDGTVVVRDTNTHSQVSVPREGLVDYLRGLKVK